MVTSTDVQARLDGGRAPVVAVVVALLLLVTPPVPRAGAEATDPADLGPGTAVTSEDGDHTDEAISTEPPEDDGAADDKVDGEPRPPAPTASPEEESVGGDQTPVPTAIPEVAPLQAASPPGAGLRMANTLFAYVEAGETIDISFAKLGWISGETDVTVTVEGPGEVSESCMNPARAPNGSGCTWTDLTTDTAGIWQIDFTPSGTTAARYAWEIIVRAGGVEQPGRVYTDRHSLSQFGDPIDIPLWYQSQEGYLYRADYFGYQGVDSVFAADATGNALAGTCVSAYESYDAGGPYGDPEFHLPGIGVCGDPYKIFFEMPSDDLPTTASLWDGSTTWLRPDVVVPQLSALTFEPEGGSVHRGDFTFQVVDFTGQLEVQVDANDDGDYDDPEDVSIRAAATDGTVTVPFDGLDGLGQPISSLRDLNARVVMARAGEIHLVNFDVETRGGLQLVALNGPSSGSDLLYWNDTQLRTEERDCTTPTLDGRAGVASTGGVHGWPCFSNPNDGVGGSWGDVRNIDDWTFAAIDESVEIAIAGAPLTVTCATDASFLNTASDGAGGSLPGGSRDLQWSVGVGDATGPDSVPSWEFAHVPSTIPAAWTASPYGDAGWISYADSATHTERIDTYYRIQFDLDASVPLDGFTLPMDFYADNSVPEVWVNGVPQSTTEPSLPQATTDPYTHGGFVAGAEASTLLSDGFHHGPNEVVVHVASDPPRVGFMAQLSPEPLCTDLGDAPEGYGTTRDGDGARHAVTDLDDVTGTSALMLGDTVDVEADGLPTAAADGDGDDEDGVAGPISLAFGTQPTVSVTATNDTAEDATLAGWIDLDVDGAFDADERVTVTVPANAGTASYDLVFPVPVASGDTYARFRLFPGDVADPAPTGLAVAGEVEDHPVAGAVLEPWACTPDGILFQSPTTIYSIDLVTGDDSTEATDYHTADINAVGYNVLDGYVYGYAGVGSDGSEREIVRVGADGTVEGLGNPDDLPVVSRHVGDVDENGHYWLANGTHWWQFDLDPTSPTYLEVLDSGSHEGMANWGFADWAYVPGGGDYLYTVAHHTSGASRLFRFDRTTNEWASHGSNLGNLGAMGAVYADADGFLYGSVNATGAIHRVDVAAATSDFFASGPASRGNDGAMCSEARVQLDFGDAPATYGTLLAGDGPRHALRDLDPDTNTASLMLGTQVDAEDDGQPAAGADLDDLDDGVADPIVVFAGEQTSVTIGATNDTAEAATLAGWIDLDADGSFDDDERVTESVPAASGFASYELTFPEGTATVDTYARFRLLPGDVTAPAPTGSATAGEVEDYLVPAGLVHYEKTVSPDDVTQLLPGDTFTYTVTASNLGSVDLTGLTFTDDLGDVVDDATYNDDVTVVSGPGTAVYNAQDEIVWSGDLAVGETATISYSVIVDDPPGGDAVLVNAVVGDGPGSNCDAAPANDPDCFTEVPQPQLSGVKTSDAGSTVDAGDTVTYELAITNTGPAAANNAVVFDDLSGVLDDAAFNGDAVASSGNVVFDEADQELVWNGPLAAAGDPGDSVTITYSVTVNGADGLGDGQLRNALLLPGCPEPAIFDPLDPGFDPDCVEVIDIEAWTSVKSSDAVGDLAPGDTVAYEVTVTNTGNVVLDDPTALPSIEDDLSDVLDDATYNTDAEANGGTLAYSAEVLSWEGPLLVGQIVTITYSVTIRDADELGDGQLTNAVTGAPNCPDPASPDPADPHFDPDCVTVSDVAAWTSTKSSNAASPTRPGDVVTYQVTVTNTGNVPLTSGEAVDPPSITDDLSGVLDDAVYNDDADAGGDGTLSYGEPVLSWTGDLAVDQVVTITYTVTVRDADALGDGQLVNAMAGGLNCPDPAITDPTDPDFDPDCVTISDIEAWTSTKSSNASAPVPPGETIEYTLTVANTGNVALDDPAALPAITDDLSGVLDDAVYNDDADAGGDGTLSYSEPVLSWTGDLAVDQVVTITYTVTVRDADALGDGQLVNAMAGGLNCPDPAITGPTDPGFDPDCVTISDIEAWTSTKSSNASAPVPPGETIEYTLTVANTGNVALDDPTALPAITDDLSSVLDDAVYNDDADAGGDGTLSYSEPVLSWTGDLAVDQVVTITYTVTVRDADALGDGQLVNAMTGGLNCPDPAITSPTDPGFDPDCVTTTDVSAYTVAKSVEAPAGVGPGDTLTYEVVVTNTGAAALTGATAATFADDLSGVLDDAAYGEDASPSAGTVDYSAPVLWWTGDLGVGEVATVTYSVTVDSPIDGDFALVNAVVGGNCPEPAITDGTHPDFDPSCVTVTDLPGIHYRKTMVGDLTDAGPGATVGYEVTVTNTGRVDLVGQSFEDDLADVIDDASYEDDAVADSGTVAYTEPVLTWTGDLAVGEVATVTYSVTLDDPLTGDGDLRNRVLGDGPNSNCAPPDPTDPVCSTQLGEPIVEVTKELVSPAEPVPGDVVTYRIWAHNRGGATAAREAIVDDLSGVLDTAAYNGDATATAGVVDYTEPQLRWEVDIASGATVELLYTVTVNPADDLGDGRLTNTVTGGSNCPPGGPVCEIDDPVRAVRYHKVIVDPTRAAVGGDEVTYEVTVTNLGGAQLEGVSFTDDLSAVLEHATWLGAAAADRGTVAYSAPVLRWDGDLEPGQVATVTYTVALDDDAPAGAAMRNVVVGDGPGSNCPPDADDPACLAVLGVDERGPAPAPPPSAPPARLPITGSNVLLLLMLAAGSLLMGRRMQRDPRQVAPRS